ncbi:Histone-lysine N-methyltransferase 2C [Trichinella murrelli]|uniref:Histone-lysine N-methyltransferase 2C n=1 Tax=Trichinella murrelli TaxID=144512 RepID=A0A0V0TYY5_9BILA|nr:Histone-lysine N-methyltransferase 2C [Trichinella murrelli]
MQFNILQKKTSFLNAHATMKHWGYAFKEAYLRFKFKITHLIVVYYLSDEVDLSYSHTSVEPISLPPQNMITGHALPENVSRKKISTFKRNSASKGKGGSTSSRSIVDKRRSQKCAKNRRNAVQTITEILNHHLAPNVAKHKEDDEYIHSVVVTSVKDSYVFCRDMCVVCGSFGRGQEGHMVACTQCGQCYHTYCANVTLNSVIVHRGWRCLDCTVCEGCGTGDDEQHLLLCDECDVSYHMYCLDPPLDSIPQGAWRCKWCSTCQFCGATPPNGMLDSIKNLRACFKCASLYSCCFCHLQYKEEDMIILCDICHRWSHANCNGLCAEDILKKGLDAGFICVYCRPGDACSSAAMHFVIEGVLLTKSGLSTVQWRPKPAASPVCSAVYNSTRSFESLQNATADGFSELSTSQIMIQDGVVSASPDMEKLDFEFSSNSDMTIYESQNGLDSFGSVDRQKRVRNRKLFKVGIGGFHTRLARSRYDKLQEECVATASPEMMGNSLGGNAQLDNNAVAAGDSIVEEGHDKPKRRKRNRRKVVLEDYYPSYIQEAFFGISAEESSYTNGGNVNGPAPFPMSPFDLQEQDIAFAIPRSPDTEINSEVIKNAESSSQVYKLRNANVLPEVCLNEAIDMNENEEIFPHELQNHDFTNLLDMLMQADMDPIVSNTDISAIDSVEMDTLMDNVFDAELKRASELTETQLLANSAAAAAEMHQPNGRCLKDLTAMCGDNAPTPFVSLPVEIGTAASQQMAPKNFNEQQTDLIGNMAGNIFPNSNNSSNSNNVNSDNMIGGGMVESTAVRPRMCESPPVEAKNYLDRWLQDEPLGDRSSIAAVLYANLNAPDLKTRYPCWPDRAKCIAKIWRSLNQDHRQQITTAPLVPLPTTSINNSGSFLCQPQQPQQQGQFGCAAQAKLLPRTPVVGDGHELMTGMRNQQGQNHSNKQQQDNKLAQVAQSVETTMHEEWLMQTVGSLEHQQKSLESELNQLRRTKKNTASKQRQMRKNGVEPPQADQAALASLTQTIGERQKLLERIRKQLKTHNSLVQDYQQQDKRVDGALSIAGGGSGQSSSYPAPAQSPVPSPAYQPAVSPMDCGFAAEPGHTAPPRSEQAFMAPTAATSESASAIGFNGGQFWSSGDERRQRACGRTDRCTGTVTVGSWSRDDEADDDEHHCAALLSANGAAYDGIPDDETVLSRTKCLNLCSMSRCYGSEVVATVKDLLDRVSDDEYGEATEAVLHMFSKIYPTDQCYDFDGSRRKGKGQLSRKRSRRSNKAKSFCGNEDAVDEMGELTDHQWFYYLQQLPPLTIVEPESRFDTAITHFYGVTPLTDCKGLVEGTLGKVTLSFAEDYYRRSCGGDGARNNSLVRMAESTTRGQIEKSFSNVKVENDFLFENRSSNSPDELIYSDGSGDEENLPCYPYLKPEMSADGRLSPNFRLVAPVPINEYVQSQQSRVVTLTLDSAAASNVSNVLRNLACLLNVDVPELFDLQIDTPPHTPDRVLSREYAETQRRFCCYCATALQQAMVKKNLAELGFTPKNDDSDEVVFCSDACFVQFAVSRKMPISPGNPSKVLPNKTVITSGFENALERSNSSSMSICTANQLRIAESENSRHRLVNNVKLDEIIRSVVGTSKVYTGTSKESVVHVRDLPRLKDTESKIEKKLKGARWQLYNNCQKSLLKVLACNTPEALWKEMLSIFWLPQSLPQDTRICELCSRMGDGETEVCGRLLNMDAGRWVHVNCVLWSAEVYETMDGGLVNVEQAVRRASVTRCVLCDLPGATIPCYKMKCGSNFHLHCAVDSRCTFMMDKTMFCFEHPPLCRDKILYNLAVFRKVYIERDDEQLLSKYIFDLLESLKLSLYKMLCFIFCLGCISKVNLVDYTVSRIYWSTFHPRRRQIYQCHIGEFEGAPLFSVTAKYPGTPEVRYQSKSINEVWQNNILTPLQGLRNCNDILKLFPSYISGESFFGLFEPSIQKMLESLPGIDSLVTYEFKYGRSLWMEPPLVLNPSGSARCEPCFRTYIKRSRKLNAMSAHSIQSLLAFSGMPSDGYFYSFGNKQSLVAKCYQYRKLKQEWKSNVYLARSKIQGLGLFANRDVEMNAMVIEYVGEVIRNEVAERREKSYQKRNRGVYMFRLDSDHVIDATVAGGPARYINHSCDPNCIAERIDFDRESRIVIMSCRPICKGEELTYDYQFDFEDELNKLPCLCRAPNCRNKEAVYMKMQTGCASCVRFTTFAEGTILALRMVSSQSFGYYTGGQHVENFAPNNACMASSPNEEFYFAVPDEQQQFVSSGPQATTYWDNSCNLNVVNPVEFQWTTDHYYPLTNWNSAPTAAAAYTHGVGNVVDEGAVPARTFIFNGQSCWNLMAEDSAIAVVKNNQIEEADEEELASADTGTVSKNRNPCRRRCAHSVIERRYRSSINERIAELKTLASKSTVLRAAIDKLKQLKQLNDSLRAENEQLKACCTCSPFSLSMHSLDFGQNNFDISVSSTEELNNNSNNSSVSTNSKFTLFLLFACVVIVNPFHMVSQISTVGVAPLGKLWNAPLLKSVDISRIRAEIIENNILRILLLSVINGLVVALVIVKLRFCRRLILKDPTCPKVKSRSLTVLGDDRGREDSPPPVPAPMVMRCSQFKRTFAEQLLQILLTFFHFILLPVNLFCLLSNVDDEEQKSADMGKFHYSNPTTLLQHFTDDKPHLSRFADKKRYSSIELALNSVKLAAKVDNKLEKPILVNVYCMAALQIRLLPWIGNSLAKLLYNRANQEYRKVESDLNVCWLFTSIGKKFFFNLNLNDKQFWLLKRALLLNSKETEEYLNFVKHSRDEFKKKRLFGVTMSNQETDYFWYVSFILFGFGQDHRASLMDERNLLKDIQELATSAVQEACCKAAIACHLGTSSENKENIVCEILQLCMDVHQSMMSSSVADYPLENITLVLAVDWCLKALIVSSEMNVHLLVNKNCTNADVNGKHMFRLLLKQKRRFISNLQPFLSRETIRYEAIGCLLDGMNPTFVQKLLMKYAKVDQFDRPWTCTNNSGGIEKWLFSLGPQQWLTSLLLSEEN